MSDAEFTPPLTMSDYPSIIDVELPELREPAEVEPTALGASAHAMLTKSLEVIEATLALRRAERDAINADVRQLVADREVVTQALGAWARAERRRATDAD